MFKAYIKLRVLRQLSRESQSGYDLMKHIGEACGKPSPGYIYPLLGNLQAKGFITAKAEGRRKVYSITQNGVGLLSELQKKRDEMMGNMAMILGSVADSGEAREMEGMMKYLKEGDMLGRLHRALFSAYCADEQRKEKLRKIVDEFIEKMKELRKEGVEKAGAKRLRRGRTSGSGTGRPPRKLK
jgi:DNA-binding PadR family transcriptional regulator